MPKKYKLSRRKSSLKSKSRRIKSVKSKSRRRRKSLNSKSRRRKSLKSKSRRRKSVKSKCLDGLYKIVKLEGCGPCKETIKLLEREQKKQEQIQGKKLKFFEASTEITPELQEIMVQKEGKDYPFFPKVFECDDNTGKCEFKGGYVELKEKFGIK